MIRDLLHQSPPAYILVNLLYGHHNTLPDEQQNSDTYRYQLSLLFLKAKRNDSRTLYPQNPKTPLSLRVDKLIIITLGSS